MNKYVACLMGAAFIQTAAFADNSAPAPSKEDLNKAVEKVNYLETTTSGIKLSGYVDAGYIYNFIGKGSKVQTEGYTSTDSSAKGNFNLNALKLTLEKPLTEENSLQAGFRTDMMFGQDAKTFNKDTVMGSNAFYLQQAYVIVRFPVAKNLDVQVGKMNSLLGFEADERPTNLNITQGVNALLDPGPSIGVLATYPVTDTLKIKFGVINGFGLDSNNGLDKDSDGYAFTGALDWQNKDGNAETQLSFHWSPWGDPGIGQQDNVELIGLNWWANWTPLFANKKLLLAVNTSFWNTGNYGTPSDVQSATYITAAVYAKYQFNELFSLAGRAEYGHTNNIGFLGFDSVTTTGLKSADLYSLTLTAGFNVAEGLTLRAEYRFDIGTDVTYNASNGYTGNMAHAVAFEAIYSF